MMDVENFWKLEGGEVNRVAIDLMRTQKPDSQLKKWLKVPGADCLLFDTITPEWITPVEKLGLPCYAMGGSVGRGSGVLSGTGFKLAQHIGKVIRELVELEHQKILLVMGRATDKSMSQVVHEQAAQVIAKYEKTKKVSLSAIMPDFANPTDWQSYWQETLPKECPSVVITDSVYLGLSLHNFCLTRRIQMPRDLSMVVLDDAEFFTWLNPIPTRYRYRKEQAFRHFRRWVRSGFVPGTTKFFTTDFVKGQTLGKATHGLRLR